ncbi:MAG: cytochrome c maturation protein CcmE [Rhodospirillales bacterium]
MKRKHKRLTFVVIAMALLGAAATLALIAFRDNIVFFYSPTEVAEKKIADGRRIRVGGLVEEGSVRKQPGAVVVFRLTDLNTSIPVQYKGLLPDLFREGQGIVAEGRLEKGEFRAEEVLAKHDETYMPPEVADALKKSGNWQQMGARMKSQKGAEKVR